MCSFFCVAQTLEGNARAALLWLMLAQLIDGLDGPLARGYEVREHVPVLSGYVLDLIVDFTTCVFAPVIFAWQFGLLGGGAPELVLLGLVLVTGALWHSRDDLETRDLWFRGFPAAWNFVFTVFWIASTPTTVNVIVTIVLIGLTIAPWYKVPHVSGAPQFRNLTVTVSLLGIGAMTVLIIEAEPPMHHLLVGLVFAWVVYYFAIGVWRSLQPDEIFDRPAHDAAVDSA